MIAASEMEPARPTPAAFRDWPAGTLAGRGWPARRRELRGPAVRAPDRLRHLPGGLRVVRLADAGATSPRNADLQRAARAEVRSALHAGRVEEHLAERPRGLPRVRHGAARDLHADEGPAVPRPRPQLRRQAVGDHDAGRHHDRGALLDRRHVHDHRRAGAGVPRDRRSRSTSTGPRRRWSRTSTSCSSRTASSSTRPTRRSTGAAATAGWPPARRSCCGRCPPTIRDAPADPRRATGR